MFTSYGILSHREEPLYLEIEILKFCARHLKIYKCAFFIHLKCIGKISENKPLVKSLWKHGLAGTYKRITENGTNHPSLCTTFKFVKTTDSVIPALIL